MLFWRDISYITLPLSKAQPLVQELDHQWNFLRKCNLNLQSGRSLVFPDLCCRLTSSLDFRNVLLIVNIYILLSKATDKGHTSVPRPLLSQLGSTINNVLTFKVHRIQSIYPIISPIIIFFILGPNFNLKRLTSVFWTDSGHYGSNVNPVLGLKTLHRPWIHQFSRAITSIDNDDAGRWVDKHAWFSGVFGGLVLL